MQAQMINPETFMQLSQFIQNSTQSSKLRQLLFIIDMSKYNNISVMFTQIVNQVGQCVNDC